MKGSISINFKQVNAMDTIKYTLSLGLFKGAVALVDTVTYGQVGAFLDTKKQMQEFIKNTTDALYTLNVDAFIKNIDIQENEWDEFIKQNPDKIKIGIEALSILKQVTFGLQAEMIAIALSLKVKDKISFLEYNKYTYIILRMNEYLFDLMVGIDTEKKDNHPHLKGLSVGVEFSNPELIGFGFLVQRKEPTFSDVYPDFDQYKYQVTEEFNRFYAYFIKK